MRTLLSTLLIATAFAGCTTEDPVTAETRSRLVGTWQEERASADGSVRRVLSLKADGKFADEILVAAPGGSVDRTEWAGEWSYDGVNLKRRYLQENGRQFSGSGMRYATFPLKAVTPSELVLDDNIQKRSATFRRVDSRGGR